MGDDCCSASELRRRYEMGGDLKDDDLTAPQLRARYGIKKNAAGASGIVTLACIYKYTVYIIYCIHRNIACGHAYVSNFQMQAMENTFGIERYMDYAFPCTAIFAGPNWQYWGILREWRLTPCSYENQKKYQ